MVDPNRVRRLLLMLERYRSLLAEDAPDPYRRRHLVQTAAQISIDLANHVIAADGYRVPRDYDDAFRVLAEVGVLDEGLAGRMAVMQQTAVLQARCNTRATPRPKVAPAPPTG